MTGMPAGRAIVHITDRALAHMRGMTSPDAPLVSIGVKSGGCNGLKYFVESTDAWDVRDVPVGRDGVQVAVCGRSLLHLAGATIGWKTDVMGARLHFENPNAASRCGCGETFHA